MQYIFYILLIPFLYLNYKIIESDIKIKKIPNKFLGYLLLLLPFYYAYLFLSFPDLNLLAFFWQIFLSFLVSFLLYYLSIWSAWDAKYLLVLTLFLPSIWVIPFTWNLALVVIAYLFLFFLRFYLWRCLLNLEYAKSLIWNIKQDIGEKWNTYKTNNWWSNLFSFLKWITVFLVIFVSIRLIRIYTVNDFLSEGQNVELLKNLLIEYHLYLIVFLLAIFIWLIRLVRNSYLYLRRKISNRFYIKQAHIDNTFILIIFSFLSYFIYIEYSINKEVILFHLYRIFTLYIIIYALVKILIYSYKLTFSISETRYVELKDIQVWDILDKKYLIDVIWKYASFDYINNPKTDKRLGWVSNKLKKKLIMWDYKEYLNNLETDEEWIKRLSQIILTKNEIYKKLDNNTPIKHVKILDAFAFAPYIIIWFIVTYIFENKIILAILEFIISIVKKYFVLW